MSYGNIGTYTNVRSGPADQKKKAPFYGHVNTDHRQMRQLCCYEQVYCIDIENYNEKLMPP